MEILVISAMMLPTHAQFARKLLALFLEGIIALFVVSLCAMIAQKTKSAVVSSANNGSEFVIAKLLKLKACACA
jgi:hypothetical protein